jgi:hypothetical protein
MDHPITREWFGRASVIGITRLLRQSEGPFLPFYMALVPDIIQGSGSERAAHAGGVGCDVFLSSEGKHELDEQWYLNCR